MAGKEVMLKSVAQSILVYAISCFNLPFQVIRDLNSLFAGFLWGDNGSKKKKSIGRHGSIFVYKKLMMGWA